VAISSRVSLHKLEVFDAVVTRGGITKAADYLGVAQPVVTAHIRSLEERVGVTLFGRAGRNLELTEAGRAVHEWAVGVLRSTRALSRDLDSVSGGLQGTVALATSMSIGSYRLPGLLGQFLRDRPAVELRVDILDAAHAIADTDAGHNDFSVVVVEAPPVNQSLAAEPLGTEDLVIVTAAAGPPDGQQVTVDELHRLPFIEAQRGSLRRSFTDRELDRIGLANRRVLIELGHPEAMKRVVAAGLGVCCLFRSAVQRELDDGDLRELTVGDSRMWGTLYLVHRKDKVFSVAQCQLIERLRVHLGDG